MISLRLWLALGGGGGRLPADDDDLSLQKFTQPEIWRLAGYRYSKINITLTQHPLHSTHTAGGLPSSNALRARSAPAAIPQPDQLPSFRGL